MYREEWEKAPYRVTGNHSMALGHTIKLTFFYKHSQLLKENVLREIPYGLDVSISGVILHAPIG